ncbi:pyruvate dehydrogenase E2 component (dihydrolipoamide acetyltransferase) [Dethiosulfatibacter aminovorans DSM 17477]|uniref:Dihydrolipoamide acetyltransferase component of pyruvate dehydrogenase complex n=1 Tax=Dethiosulfatibacter aminovorans DSM 17477 TaxID=1121476 RepID=A0A1M6ANI8_9FIRM|nr:dihydrolipoamide acetyltransferase family protein [Dethiosulfatibacter aminovorans]SHI38074.1 pyruvate dehydrogenase E2 component (dihydrolipoamide acetyltransferase) [Dethiosulfatibacter aminovorans DSM 17477]
MADIIVMPKLGLTMKEGKIGKWLKNEGDFINKGDALLEVTTDKLANEIESNYSGYVRKIVAQEGDSVACLLPIAVIGDQDEDISSVLGDEVAEKPLEEKKVIVLEKKAGEPVKAGGRIKASPAARKRAKELGVSLEDVAGGGHQGRIGVEDVEKYLENRDKVKASPTAKKLASSLNVDIGDIDKDGRIMKQDVVDYSTAQGLAARANPQEERAPMSQMRKVIAERMSQSWDVSPAVTYDMKVEMTELLKLKNRLKETQKLTITDLLVKISSSVLLEFPLVNSTIDGDEIITRNYANIGVAVAIDEGLVVPVVKYANVKGLKEISAEVRKLASKAKSNNLSSDDMQGGTFTVTNLGMFGMNAFSPIINQPEVAILGVNAIEDVLFMENGQVKSKPLMTLSLTADHRAVDGAVAANFLKRFKTYIECPEILML